MKNIVDIYCEEVIFYLNEEIKKEEASLSKFSFLNRKKYRKLKLLNELLYDKYRFLGYMLEEEEKNKKIVKF